MSAPENKITLITMGCPVGIGPEIILKYFASAAGQAAGAVVVGDAEVLKRCAARLSLPAEIIPWQPGDNIRPGTLPVFIPADYSLAVDELSWGRPDRSTGLAMASFIKNAVSLLQQGEARAMTTCPIAKSSLNQAGFNYPGHTEMLADLCRTAEYGMMLAGSRLRVTLVTIHVGLKEVSGLLTRKKITAMIMATFRTLRDDFAIKAPRLAVAGLNPHAGEEGMFGDEEIKIIEPAVLAARDAGCNAYGPFPPDTIFGKAAAGDFDAVVCMYHDQGLIPFKLIHFSDGVNVTFGLPIVRTSVDHGTAYDIAGQGIADPASLAAAVDMAGEIAANRRRNRQ